MERSKLITIYANDLLHCQVIGDTIDESLGACRRNLAGYCLKANIVSSKWKRL
jgi:hypothetical protein